MRWRELTEELIDALGSTEAGFVITHISGISPGALVPLLNQAVDAPTVEAAQTIVERSAHGEPLQHILGSWGFRTLDVHVDARALIPRPETEMVVEVALAELDRIATNDPIALDLGVGSGVIACALAAERSELRVIGVDVSTAALELASENRALLGSRSDAVGLCAGEWYGPFGRSLEGRCSLIVSNPPYLSAAEWSSAPPVVREWDPYVALVGGPIGTEAIEIVVAGASRYLTESGALVLEIGADQGDAVRELGRAAGACRIDVGTDLAGRDRSVVMAW